MSQRANSSPAKRSLLSVFTAALALACSGIGGPPDWLTAPYDGLSPETHLASVGTGADRQSASANAQGALSQIFRAQVDQEITDTQQVETQSNDGKTRARVVQDVQIRTRVSSRASLEGVEISDVWEDADGTRHARAVLDKVAMRKALEVQITENANTIRSQIEAANTSPSPLVRARALFRALEPAVERVELVRRYQVVDGRASSTVDGKSPQEISLDAERALSEVAIFVSARETDRADGSSGAPAPHLRRRAAETLTKMGFQVAADDTPEGEQAVALRLILGITRVERGVPGWTFYRWEGSFDLSSRDDAIESLAVSTARGEESHTDPAVARARAVEKGSIALIQNLESRLSDYLYEAPEEGR